MTSSSCCVQYGESALWYASSAGHVGVVEVLLEFGAQVNLPNVSYMYKLYLVPCMHMHMQL